MNERCAPIGKYRVIGVDSFDGSDWHEGDFDTAADAVQRAKEKDAAMRNMYVYDDTGRCIGSTGNLGF